MEVKVDEAVGVLKVQAFGEHISGDKHLDFVLAFVGHFSRG